MPLILAAGAGCVAGAGVGLWSLLGDKNAGSFLLGEFFALAGVMLVALFVAFIIAKTTSRAFDEIFNSLERIRKGEFKTDPRPEGPRELQELGNEIRELGVFLEERDRERTSENEVDARKLRQESLKRFGQGVSREIQKSLAGILGFVEIALRQPNVEGQLKNYLTLIDQEARAGREALERVLQFIREEEFPTEPLDVNDLLLDTSRSFMDTLEKQKIQVQLNLSQSIPRVLADASQIKHVLSTLIENAREAMMPEGGTLELSTNLNQNKLVVVMVKDTGRGIPADDHPRIFTPFFTSKGSQKGAGLSLSIAERIVSQHGGKLDFWSTVGEGSVFFIQLPPVSADAL